MSIRRPWKVDGVDDSLRSLHHIAGGHFFAIGNEVKYTPISEG